MLHTAISANQKIRFQYFQWNVKKEMELRHGGQFYEVSPWALSWDDENYYLVAFDSKENKIKHFRVDKMLKISLVEEKREGRDNFQSFDMAVYARKMFGMFGGKEENVKLICKNQMAGVMIDRFGKDITLIPVDDKCFSLTVKVAVSGQFLGWVFALGDGVRIAGPKEVVSRVEEEVRRLSEQYLQVHTMGQ